MNKYFTNEEINFIISTDKVNDYDKNTLDIKTKELFNYLISKKISISNIKEMILDYPRLLTYSLTLISDNYDNIEKIFNKNTNKLLISNPRILSRSKEYLNEIIKCFLDFGLSSKEILKLCLDFPIVFTLGQINIDISIKNLQEKISNKDMLIKLISTNSKVLSYSNKTINEKFAWFYKKGYSKEQTAHLVCKAETILTQEYENKENRISNIGEKYNFLSEEMQYNQNEIIKITCCYPEYYTLALDTVKKRIANLIKLGFDINTVKFIFYNFPQIISFKISTINEKYDYYLKLDMLDIFIKKPKYLMQSLLLTELRYNYLINKKINVDKSNFSKLFLSSKKFKKTYGIDNDELLKIYKENGGNYEQRTNNKNTI